jgi:hypothetical protein
MKRMNTPEAAAPDRLGPPRFAWGLHRAHRCLSGRAVPWPLSGALVSLGLEGFLGSAVSARLRLGRYLGKSGRSADISQV